MCSHSPPSRIQQQQPPSILQTLKPSVSRRVQPPLVQIPAGHTAARKVLSIHHSERQDCISQRKQWSNNNYVSAILRPQPLIGSGLHGVEVVIHFRSRGHRVGDHTEVQLAQRALESSPWPAHMSTTLGDILKSTTLRSIFSSETSTVYLTGA